jgi:hypothetical protein
MASNPLWVGVIGRLGTWPTYEVPGQVVFRITVKNRAEG